MILAQHAVARFILNMDFGGRVKVIIRKGPMAAFSGIFIDKVGSEDRVRMLLETVSYQAHLSELANVF